MAGLLDSSSADFDPSVASQLQGLLAQYQPTQNDKDAARKQMLLTMGFGLLGTPRGQEAAGIGRAGQRALAAQQQYLENAQVQKLRALQAGSSALDLLNKQYQYNDAELLRRQQLEAAKRFTAGP